jgi:hypothetical protein
MHGVANADAPTLASQRRRDASREERREGWDAAGAVLSDAAAPLGLAPNHTFLSSDWWRGMAADVGEPSSPSLSACPRLRRR